MRIASLTNITAHYGGQDALKGVSFEINAGEKLGLIGANGSGKTTLLRILLGQEEPGGARYRWHRVPESATSRSTSRAKTTSW
jgi:ABC-type multidrug transport system ATPase subunit